MPRLSSDSKCNIKMHVNRRGIHFLSQIYHHCWSTCTGLLENCSRGLHAFLLTRVQFPCNLLVPGCTLPPLHFPPDATVWLLSQRALISQFPYRPLDTFVYPRHWQMRKQLRMKWSNANSAVVVKNLRYTIAFVYEKNMRARNGATPSRWGLHFFAGMKLSNNRIGFSNANCDFVRWWNRKQRKKFWRCNAESITRVSDSFGVAREVATTN